MARSASFPSSGGQGPGHIEFYVVLLRKRCEAFLDRSLSLGRFGQFRNFFSKQSGFPEVEVSATCEMTMLAPNRLHHAQIIIPLGVTTIPYVFLPLGLEPPWFVYHFSTLPAQELALVLCYA